MKQEVMEQEEPKKTRGQRFFDWVHRGLVRVQKLINTIVMLFSLGIATMFIVSRFVNLSSEVYNIALIFVALDFVLYGLSFDVEDVSKKRALVKNVEIGFAHSEGVTFDTYGSMIGDIYRNWKSRLFYALLVSAGYFFADRADFWSAVIAYLSNFFSRLVNR